MSSRRKSAWVDGPTLARLLKLLAHSLARWAGQRHFILSMDTAPAHTTAIALNALARGGLHPTFIGAAMTPWLQPLDVAAFRLLKSALRRRYHEVLSEENLPAMTNARWLQVLLEVCQTSLTNRSWNKAFAFCGLDACRVDLSRRLLKRAQWARAPEISAEMPTLRELQCCWRLRSEIPIRLLFRLLLTPGDGGQASARRLDEDDDPPGLPVPADPWHTRLRSALRQPDAQEPDAPPGSAPKCGSHPPPATSDRPWTSQPHHGPRPPRAMPLPLRAAPPPPPAPDPATASRQ